MYVIECMDGSLYTGYSLDVFRRYQQHVDKKGAKYTKSHPPKRLLYFEEFDNKHDAMHAEYQFKKLTRKNKIKYLSKRKIYL